MDVPAPTTFPRPVGCLPGFGFSGPFCPNPEQRHPVELCCNVRLTAEDHFQDVRHIEFRFVDAPPPAYALHPTAVAASPLSTLALPAALCMCRRCGLRRFELGDVVGILPENPDADVHTLLRRMGWEGSTSVRLHRSLSTTKAGLFSGLGVCGLAFRGQRKWHTKSHGADISHFLYCSIRRHLFWPLDHVVRPAEVFFGYHGVFQRLCIVCFFSHPRGNKPTTSFWPCVELEERRKRNFQLSTTFS